MLQKHIPKIRMLPVLIPKIMKAKKVFHKKLTNSVQKFFT